METRTCACQCGGTFRVMATSLQRCVSRMHEEDAIAAGAIKVRPKAVSPPTRVDSEPIQRKQEAPAAPTQDTQEVSVKAKDEAPGITVSEISATHKVPKHIVYYWVKTGKIQPIPGEGRAKFDPDAVRAFAENIVTQIKKKEPRVRSNGGGKRAGKLLQAESVTEKPGKRPAAPQSVIEVAALDAYKAFKRSLRRQIQSAQEASDAESELQALRALVAVDRNGFVKHLISEG